MNATGTADGTRITHFYFNSGDLTKRVVWSLIIEILIFLVTVILAMVDSSAWPETFFWVTMGSVVVLNSKLLKGLSTNDVKEIIGDGVVFCICTYILPPLTIAPSFPW